MEKKNLLVTLGLVFCTGCFAQDYVKVNLASGTKEYKVDEIKSFTFDGNSLKVNKQDGSAADSYQMAEIKDITFDMTSGIEDMKIAGGKLTLSVAPGSDLININGYDSKERYTVAVYNLAGEKVMGIDSWKGTAVDVSALPKGVYVFKINNTTLKIRK